MEDLFEISGASRHVSEKFSLCNVNLAARPGEIIGFVGANGAGKTTVIRALLGLLRIDAGEVRLFGEPFGANAPDAEQRRLRARIGVVLDSCPFPAELTVKQATACVSPAFPNWSQATFAQLIDEFGISPKAKIKELSRGMGMKLQLAVALSHDAELLVLDEATAGLDPIARDEVLDTLRAFASAESSTGASRAVLLSSHITTDLERIADRVAGIDAGRIAFNLPREAITDTAGIAHCSEARAREIFAVYGEIEAGDGSERTTCPARTQDRANRPTSATQNESQAAAIPKNNNIQMELSASAQKSTPSDSASPSAARGSSPHRASSQEFAISLPRAMRREFCVDVLVPNRFDFAQAFPDVACDRASIDDYLQFALRGTRSL